MAKTNAQIIASNGVLLKPTPAAEIPVPLKGVVTVELETGRVVEMVIAELAMLYDIGDIPQELVPLAARELFPPPNEPVQERERRYRERLKLARWVVSRVLVHPRVVDVPQGDDEIAIGQLYHTEIWDIYDLTNSPARAMDNFRRQQARHVENLSRQ